MSLLDERTAAQPPETEPDELDRWAGRVSPTTQSETPGKWPRRIGLSGIAALLIGGGVWWLLGSTVPQGDYDDRAADLAAAEARLVDADAALAAEEATGALTRSALATTEDQLSIAERDLATEQLASAQLVEDLDAATASFGEADAARQALVADIESLTTEGDTLELRLSDVERAARLLAYIELNIPSDVFDDLQSAGVDMTAGDDLLALLDEDDTWEQWSESASRWMGRERAIAFLGDAELQNSYDQWIEAQPGSDAEWAAWIDVYLRVVTLIVQPAVGS
jgi:hypothetical protein